MNARELARATEMLRKPGARLAVMNTHSGKEYFVIPGGPVSREVAAELIKRPDVYGSEDGLFPGMSQTWKFDVPTTFPPRGQTAASANAGRLSICGNE